MAVIIGSARSDERGKITGGTPGDQTGLEVSTQNWYKHNKGWVVIRAKDETVRKKIAYAMKAACDNDNIGYDQLTRNGLYNAVKNKGFDPAKCTEKVNSDCSATIRVCVCYAGIMVPDFNTSMEVNVLRNTCKFDILTDPKYTDSPNLLVPGDILVTKVKGHTVAVISTTNHVATAPVNAPSVAPTVQKTTSEVGPGVNLGVKKNIVVNNNPASSPSGSVAARYTIRNGNRGPQVSILQSNLNQVNHAGLVVDGICGPKTTQAIKDFQAKNRLEVDGIYGINTFNAMKRALN